MAIIKCSECDKDVSTEAVACPHCGAKQSKAAGSNGWVTALSVVAFLVVGIFIIGVIAGPKTTVDLAHDVTEDCIKHQGNGDWVGSMGSLETFCKIKGDLAGIKEACKINPAGC